jgi:hypothetical protein
MTNATTKSTVGNERVRDHLLLEAEGIVPSPLLAVAIDRYWFAAWMVVRRGAFAGRPLI